MADTVVETESDAVRGWMVERFRKLGFNKRQRARLIDAHASWHEAETLLKAGCPLELVFDILT
jgi:hypothetical protein